MTVAAENVDNSLENKYVKKFAKQMLKGSLFTGIFKEKRYVEELGSYRDVITISPEETDFIQNIKVVKEKIDREVLIKRWVGITEPKTIGAPVGYNLWVVLPEEVFGKFWFKVKTITFQDKEIRLELEIVRSYQRDSTPIRNVEEAENLSAIFEEKKLYLMRNVSYFFKEVMTLQNFVTLCKFIIILVGMASAGLINSLQYLLDWSLRFIREISGLVRAFTPIAVNTSNMFLNIIFGIFKLIYALFKPKEAPTYNNYITFDPNKIYFNDPRNRYNKYFNRQIPYYGPRPLTEGGPTITPLD